MRAIWISPSERACSAEDLRAEGIVAETFDPLAHAAVAQTIRDQRNWNRQDEVRLSVSNPRDEALIAREVDEHLHVIDEVRLFLEGEGVYDVRSRDERWIRIWVSAGDMVVIPGERYHRFLPGANVQLRYLQIYSDRRALTPMYRVSSEETRVG
jgi:1,2-dihydroxy-3-keto-5-methylthiopentene dioxygenase